MNKKAQVAGTILAVVTLFIVAIILLFMNHMNKQVYDKFDEFMNDSSTYNNTEAHDVVRELQDVEGSSIWDYVFLAVFVGMIIQMVVLAFASRTNVLFFWIYVILALVVVVLGSILSNIWQEVAAEPAFTETLTRFTITDTILGSYYPTIITGIIFFAMIFIFGKFPGQTEEQQ
jgi:hypothetical protein